MITGVVIRLINETTVESQEESVHIGVDNPRPREADRVDKIQGTTAGLATTHESFSEATGKLHFVPHLATLDNEPRLES